MITLIKDACRRIESFTEETGQPLNRSGLHLRFPALWVTTEFRDCIKQWKLRVEDKRIAAIVKRCAEIPGHELFKYLDDDGRPRMVDPGTSTPTSKTSRARTSAPRISGRGRGRFLRRSPSPNSRSTIARPRRSATWSPRLRASRSSSATRRRSAGSATCTRKS
jgi:hypothetical protein